MLTKITKEAQAKITEEVYKYPQRWVGGVCAYGMYDKKTGGYTTGSPASGPCHAYLSRPTNRAVVVVNAHKSEWHQTNKAYMEWVLREAPFSHAVLNKDNDDEVFNHAAVIDLEATGTAGAMWHCKAMRHFKENTWVPDLWSRLRDEGLDGLQAFIGADILGAEGSRREGSTHVALFNYDTPTNLRKFYDEFKKIKKLDGTEARRGELFGGVVPWGDMKGKTVKKPDGWGGFVEKLVPGEAKDYAASLREIFEGDPKNVG